MTAARVVALLGAESTGKTDLARALAARIGERRPCTWIPEYLREWCDTAGRTPRPHEQWHIAREQQRRIEAALAADAEALVLADTTPVMTAVYSDYVFGDPTLYDEALAWHRRAAGLTLVTALDLPWLPDGLQRDGPQAREPVDTMLRGALADGGIAFAVVYGDGPRRVDNALRAIERWQPGATMQAASPVEAEGRRVRWRRRCLDCLDPDCERLLHLG